MSKSESGLNEIPYGYYCYTIKEIVKNNSIFRIKTNLCSYYQYLNDGQIACSLIGINQSIDDSQLINQIKICSENELDDVFIYKGE